MTSLITSKNISAASSSSSSSSIPWGIIIGLVIGLIFLSILGYTLYYFCTLYCFYISDEDSRPQYLFTHSQEDTDCGTICCININKKLILQCCPSLKEAIKTAHIYQRGAQELNVAYTGSHFSHNTMLYPVQEGDDEMHSLL